MKNRNKTFGRTQIHRRRNLNGTMADSRFVRKYLTCSPGEAVNACRIVRNVDNIRAPFTNVNLDGPGDAIPDVVFRYCTRVEMSVE